MGLRPAGAGPCPIPRPALARIVGLTVLAIAGSTCALGNHLPQGTGGMVTGTGGAGTGGAGTGGGQGGGCAAAADCPAPSDACSVATCTAGVCGTASAPKGTLAMKDSPPNCHAKFCDGMGQSQEAVDPTNVPVSSDPCQVGTCDDVTGAPGTTPAAAGAACTSATGGKVCDGSGNCVECLHDSDCPAGHKCGVLNTCMGPPCMDGVLDGNETDVDCGGGTCPPCGVGLMCKVGTDCTSGACDALVHTCLGPQCSDGVKDGNETDVDCGGSCGACAVGKGCAVDQDCLSEACDGVSLTCAANQCVDHQKDGTETDVDCGGGTCPLCALGKTCGNGGDCASNYCNPSHQCAAVNQCVNQTDVGCGGGGACPPCALGKMCQVLTDCVSMACDAVTLVCVSDHCFDHAEDGDETDLDCGGPTCVARCTSGKYCKLTSDCAAGLTCAATAHICE